MSKAKSLILKPILETVNEGKLTLVLFHGVRPIEESPLGTLTEKIRVAQHDSRDWAQDIRKDRLPTRAFLSGTIFMLHS